MARDILKTYTHQHLRAARTMPNKRVPAFRRERKVIAKYYRQLRKIKPEEYGVIRTSGPKKAREHHHLQIVNSGKEARLRLKNMKD